MKNKGGHEMIQPVLDIRQAWRSTVRQPRIALTVILLLAAGVALSTTAFTAVYGVVLKPLGYLDEDRLIWISETLRRDAREVTLGLNHERYRRLQQDDSMLEGVALYGPNDLSVAVSLEDVPAPTAWVSSSLFQILGVEPALGRGFQPDEELPGGPCVAVVSHGFWTSRLAQKPLERAVVRLGAAPCELVGVMPKGFMFPDTVTQAWIPKGPQPGTSTFSLAIARRRANVSLPQVVAQISAMQDSEDLGVQALPWRTFLVGDTGWLLLSLLAASGCLFLIAVGNAANLLATRTLSRAQEMGIRIALGAGRPALFRQLLAESLIIALTGSGLGLAASLLLKRGTSFAAAEIPLLEGVSPGLASILFGLVCALAAAAVFVLTTRFKLPGGSVMDLLRQGDRQTVGRTRSLSRDAVAAGQIALALALSIAAGLSLNSMTRLLTEPVGFMPANVWAVDLHLPKSKYATPHTQLGAALDLLREVLRRPEVSAAGFAIGSLQRTGAVSIENGGDALVVDFQEVSAGYLQSLNAPTLSGRFFEEGESGVALVNETLAQRLFGERDPLHARVELAGDEDLTVVGVVADIKMDGPQQAPAPRLYRPLRPRPAGARSWGIRVHMIARFSEETAPAGEILRSAAAAVDAEMRLDNMIELRERLAGLLVRPRFWALVLSLFAVLGSASAIAGTYSVVSESARQRTREFGVRLALGASARDVLKLVLGRAVVLTTAGLIVGLAAAAALTRLMDSLLFEVSGTDPVTFIATSLSLASAALLGGLLPARRAASLNPLEALRCE